MLAALETEMPPGTRWTRPQGGLFVWLTLPEGQDAEALVEAAVAGGVAYVPGASFFVDGTGDRTMRLTFAKETAESITEGVRRLATVVKADTASSTRSRP